MKKVKRQRSGDTGTIGDGEGDDDEDGDDDGGLMLDGEDDDEKDDPRSPVDGGRDGGGVGYSLSERVVVTGVDDDAITTSDDESVLTDIVDCMDDAAALAYEDERHGADEYILYGIRAQDLSLWAPLMPSRLQVSAARAATTEPSKIMIEAGMLIRKQQGFDDAIPTQANDDDDEEEEEEQGEDKDRTEYYGEA